MTASERGSGANALATAALGSFGPPLAAPVIVRAAAVVRLAAPIVAVAGPVVALAAGVAALSLLFAAQALFFVPLAHAQMAGASPANPHLAASPWPIALHDGYAQHSLLLPGPEPRDALAVEVLRIPKGARESPGPAVALLSEPYPDGARAVWSVNSLRVLKLRLASALDWVDSKIVDPIVLPALQRYELLLTRDNEAIVADPRGRLLRFGDEREGDSRAPIVQRQAWDLPEPAYGRVAQLAMSHDGRIVLLTDAGWIGAVRVKDFGDPKWFLIERYAQETIGAKRIAIDESGAIFLSTSRRVLRIDWDGTRFTPSWSVDLDPVGRTSAGTPGTGTGPSLMGTRAAEDRLVVLVDSGRPCYALALWRDGIPEDWPGQPGRDRRVAGMTPAQAVCASDRNGGWPGETSVAVSGTEFVAARYNGRYYGLDDPFGETGLTDGLLRNVAGPREPEAGVQKFRWDPARRALESVWRNDEVNINSVPTVSVTSGLVYGIGARAGKFMLYGIDWSSGRLALAALLGSGAAFVDGGSDLVLSDDRSLLYGSAAGLVRIRPVR